MVASTDISLRERHRLKLENFRGVDLTRHETNVASNRASYMRNFIMRDGLNSKRHGWREIARIVDDEGNGKRINGLFPFSRALGTEKHFIVHAEDSFYEIVQTSSDPSLEALELNMLGEHTGYLKNGKSQVFWQGKKAYITGGCYLRYSAEGLCLIVNSPNDEDVYIPVTSSNINDVTTVDSVTANPEPVNLLTSYRYNKLVGKNDYFVTWKLDSAIQKNTPVEIKVLLVGVKGEDSITFEVALDNLANDGDTECGVLSVSRIRYLDSETTLYTRGGEQNNADFFKNWFYTEEDDSVDFNSVGSIDYTQGSIKLNFKTTQIGEYSNITVKFSARYSDVGSFNCVICNAEQGILFGVDGRGDTLFLTDGSNKIYFSEAGEFNYFPDTNFITVGENQTANIVGFTVASDNTLIVFKERSASDAGIYYVNGSYYDVSVEDGVGNISTYQRPIYTVTRGDITEYMLNPCCTANLCGENLFLSERGVFGISMAENLSIVQRNTFERSEAIKKELLSKDLAKACAVVYDDRYYLAVDGKCYVADARYKYSTDDARSGAYDYEWWVWDNIPATAFAVLDNKLYFGAEDGRICVFDEEFSDRQILKIEDGLSLSTLVGMPIEVYCDTQFCQSLRNGQKVRFEFKDSYGEDVDVYVALDDGCENINGQELYVAEKSDEGHFCLRYYNDDESPLLKCVNPQYSESAWVVPPTDITAYFELKEDVVAEWETPAFDLGTNIYSKSLCQTTVSARAVSRGSLEFGYETRKNLFSAEVKGINMFSFEDLSFEDFTFDTGFPVSYTKRVKERNFNYIKFKFKSEGDRDCGIKDLTAVYKINKANKGVM